MKGKLLFQQSLSQDVTTPGVAVMRGHYHHSVSCQFPKLLTQSECSSCPSDLRDLRGRDGPPRPHLEAERSDRQDLRDNGASDAPSGPPQCKQKLSCTGICAFTMHLHFNCLVMSLNNQHKAFGKLILFIPLCVQLKKTMFFKMLTLDYITQTSICKDQQLTWILIN